MRYFIRGWCFWVKLLILNAWNEFCGFSYQISYPAAEQFKEYVRLCGVKRVKPEWNQSQSRRWSLRFWCPWNNLIWCRSFMVAWHRGTVSSSHLSSVSISVSLLRCHDNRMSDREEIENPLSMRCTASLKELVTVVSVCVWTVMSLHNLYYITLINTVALI